MKNSWRQKKTKKQKKNKKQKTKTKTKTTKPLRRGTKIKIAFDFSETTQARRVG